MAERELPVRTVYYRGRDVVKVIASGHPMYAVRNCGYWLRINKYEATHAEVYSTDNGKLYAVVKRDMKGNVHSLYEAPKVSTAELQALGVQL